MSRIRIILLSMLAVVALSAVAASAASAVTPTFVHCVPKTGGKWMAGCLTAGTTYEKEPVPAGSKIKFTDKSGPGTLTVAGIKVKCKKDTSKGEITGPTTVAGIVVTFEECVSTKAEKECKTNSPGAKAGEIITKELKGELGTVAKAEAASETGLLLEPVSGSEFTTLVGNECTVETKVTGKVAGEVTPVGKLQTTGKLEFKTVEGKGEKQSIKKITTDSGKEESPSLKAFGLAATEETSDENTYEEAVEVS